MIIITMIIIIIFRLYKIQMKSLFYDGQDPALEVNDTYDAYVKGRDADIYIKWPDNSTMPAGDHVPSGRLDMMGYVSISHVYLDDWT